MLVGENLGTVPPEVNTRMRRHRLHGMFVSQYEQRPDPKRALAIPPRECVASLNTHDMPAFAAHWQGLDILDRADLGILPKASVPGEQQTRRKMNAALVRFLRGKGLLRPREAGAAAVLRACLAYLSASPAEIVLVNLEDLWLEENPQNVPGTSRERPNWRRKARFTLEQIQSLPEVREILEMVNRLRKGGAPRPRPK
jgi:4-alpha-glucanotransferase